MTVKKKTKPHKKAGGTPKSAPKRRLPPRDASGRFTKKRAKKPLKRDSKGRFISRVVPRRDAHGRFAPKSKARDVKGRFKPGFKPPARQRVEHPSKEGLKPAPRPVERERSIHRRARREVDKVTDRPASKKELKRLREMMKAIGAGFPGGGEVYIQPLLDYTVDAELRFGGQAWTDKPDDQLLVLEQVYEMVIRSYPDLWDWWVRIRIDFRNLEPDWDLGETDITLTKSKASVPTNVVRKLDDAAVVFEAARAVVQNMTLTGVFEVLRVSLWFYKSAERPLY